MLVVASLRRDVNMNMKTLALVSLLLVGMVAAAPAASADIDLPSSDAGNPPPCEVHAVIDLDNKTVDFASILACIS